MTLDITQFYQTFFDEADELLAQMEQLLLGLDAGSPDPEDLAAIFRAAHSIKGGAAAFGFAALTDTTHILESLLDRARNHEITLTLPMIDAFLETKDVLSEQLADYHASAEPDAAAAAAICAKLEALLQGALGQAAAPAPVAAPAPAAVQPAAHEEEEESEADLERAFAVAAAEFDAAAGNGAPEHVVTQALEAAHPGSTAAGAGHEAAAAEGPHLRIVLRGVGAKDRELLVEELGNLGRVVGHQEAGDDLTLWLDSDVPSDDIVAVLCFVIDESQISIGRDTAPGAEGSSIRVGVEKVDQLINLVGELVITQAMLSETTSAFDPALHDRLYNGMAQLERNARDLQEAVMSIRMMPMDYVFSRFPRLVRDLAAKLGKEVELVTFGQATELDKSLIERIIDPLTHLVRNSLDHGIETVEKRRAAGKDAVGQLVLSAAHHGGNIVIEVSDDGAGLNRERILAKAAQQGIPVSDTISDDEVWNLIFAPGFSTAETITDVSGRRVGMDVVKRNIQAMGGRVEISSLAGRGTITRIVLPLTLAILDGMSVKVGNEIFILPLNFVMESLQPAAADICTVGNGERVVRVRGEYLPLVALHEVFSVAEARTDPTQGIVTIMETEGRRFAMLIDELVGQQQVVVKNLETNYRKVHGISAATILGDGSVALIVDVAALNRDARSAHGAGVLATF
ncbi:MAG: chemotaxis protein CheW [Burkholderia sp.]